MFFLMFLFVLKKIAGEVITAGELKRKGTGALRIERCDCEVWIESYCRPAEADQESYSCVEGVGV